MVATNIAGLIRCRTELRATDRPMVPPCPLLGDVDFVDIRGDIGDCPVGDAAKQFDFRHRMTSALAFTQMVLAACAAATIVSFVGIDILHTRMTILLGRLERAEERIREAEDQIRRQAHEARQADAEGRQEARLYLREVTSRSECSSRLT